MLNNIRTAIFFLLVSISTAIAQQRDSLSNFIFNDLIVKGDYSRIDSFFPPNEFFFKIHRWPNTDSSNIFMDRIKKMAALKIKDSLIIRKQRLGFDSMSEIKLLKSRSHVFPDPKVNGYSLLNIEFSVDNIIYCWESSSVLYQNQFHLLFIVDFKLYKKFGRKHVKFLDEVDSIREVRMLKPEEVLMLADECRRKADIFHDLVGKYKSELIMRTGGLDTLGIPIGKSDQTIGETFFISENGGQRGMELKEAMDDFRKFVAANCTDTAIINRCESLLSTDEIIDSNDPEVLNTWVERWAKYLPMASVTANLSLYQAYVRNVEADYVGWMANQFEED